MRTLLGWPVVLVVCFGVSAQEKKDEKIDAKKLVGKWEPKEQKEGRLFLMEFLKDGKLVVVRTTDEKESKFDGTYTVEGNKLTLVLKADGKDQTDTRTISKLTDTELVTTDDKGGKEFTLVRAKDKK